MNKQFLNRIEEAKRKIIQKESKGQIKKKKRVRKIYDKIGGTRYLSQISIIEQRNIKKRKLKKRKC